mgnify:CR=1 FL=1
MSEKSKEIMRHFAGDPGEIDRKYRLYAHNIKKPYQKNDCKKTHPKAKGSGCVFYWGRGVTKPVSQAEISE